ncbi:MAG: hypothetical protein ACREJ3_15980 [Polyangiaceae bacterium]
MFSKKSPPETSWRLRSFRAPWSIFPALRTLLFGLVAIVGAVWGLVRHCTQPLPPLRVPAVPATAPTYDADAGERPVPGWLEENDAPR